MTEITKIEPQAIATTGPQDDMSAMMRIAVEQGEAGVAALERLVAMKERDEDRTAARYFAASMRAVQAEGVTVVKDRRNDQTNSDYATYSAIARALKPVYTGNGFSLMFGEGVAVKDGDIRIIVDVMHEGGHTVQRFVDLPPDKAGIKGSVNKTDIHAKGSAFSYGERYLTVMIFCPDAVDKDDDGNVAGAKPRMTAEHVADLRAIIDEIPGDAKANLDKYLKWAGVLALGDLTEERYDDCVRVAEAGRGK